MSEVRLEEDKANVGIGDGVKAEERALS